MPRGRRIDLASLGISDSEAGDDDAIPPNLRLLVIAEAVAQAGVPVTPTQVNQTLGLPKQTIHRLFQTLEDEGFLQRSHDGRSYSPGRRLNGLAYDVVSSERIRTVRLAILRGLADTVGETCNIALPDRDGMVYLERVETDWPLRIQLPIGTRVPFHATASGKLFLSKLDPRRLDAWLAATDLDPRTEKTLVSQAALRAELDRIREQGFATDDEEFMDGMVALAVPVHDAGTDEEPAGDEGTGRLVSTISFHAPTMRMDIETALTFLPALREAAKALEGVLER